MELAHGLGPTFGMQIHLDVDAMWSCSLFAFFMELVWEQMLIYRYAPTLSLSSQICKVI